MELERDAEQDASATAAAYAAKAAPKLKTNGDATTAEAVQDAPSEERLDECALCAEQEQEQVEEREQDEEREMGPPTEASPVATPLQNAFQKDEVADAWGWEDIDKVSSKTGSPFLPCKRHGASQ